MITEESKRKMGWRRKKIFSSYFKNCKVCGKKFKTIPSQDKKCCSYKCNGIRRRKEKIKYICLICGKDIYDYKTRKRKYCSTKCKIEALARLRKKRFENIRIYRKWKGSRELKEYLIKTYGACQICGWKVEVNVLEAHHKDRNKKNNNENNLILICPNCHSIDHYNNKDGQYKNNLGKRYAIN